MVSCLAKKKFENTLIKENAGKPKEKYNKAIAEFCTLISEKDPYPNNAEIIGVDAMNKATVAGILKNKLNSKALF